MSTQVLLPLTKCPHCEHSGEMLLNTSKLMKYFRDAPANGLRLHETNGQELIIFNSEEPPGPCPHLLQLWGYFTVEMNNGQQERVRRYLDIDWCHPLLEVNGSFLSHFVWEFVLDDNTPHRFKGTVPVERCEIDYSWSALVDGLGHQRNSIEGSVLFTPDIQKLSQGAKELVDAHDAWWTEKQKVQQ